MPDCGNPTKPCKSSLIVNLLLDFKRSRVTGRGSPRLSEKVGSEVGHFPDFGLSSESVRHGLGMGMGRVWYGMVWHGHG